MKVHDVGMKLVALAAVTLGALAIAAYYYHAAGGDLPFSGHKYTVSAVVREPQDLLKHGDVRAAGLKVGQVSNITPELHGWAKVQMKLDNKVKPLYRDATVFVRQKTLVGENYIELTRGHPQAGVLPDSATLPVSQDHESVPLDRILNSLDAKTRADISGTLQSLGSGFTHRGNDLNRLLAALQPTLSDGSRVTDVLQAQKSQVADVIQQAGTVFDAINNRRAAMQGLIRSARQTAAAVAARDSALETAFQRFPDALNQANESVAKLGSFSTHAVPVVANLRTGLGALRPVVRDLRPTADAGRALFAKLPALLRVANPMLDRLRGFSKLATPALPALDAMLRQANPALDFIKPYSKDVGALLSNFGNGGQSDAYGSTLRCSCPVSDESVATWTPSTRAAVAALLDAGVIAKVQHVNYNPLKRPHALPDEAGRPWDGTAYPRIMPAPQR